MEVTLVYNFVDFTLCNKVAQFHLAYLWNFWDFIDVLYVCLASLQHSSSDFVVYVCGEIGPKQSNNAREREPPRSLS